MTVKESLILYFLLLKIATTIALSFLDAITYTQQVVCTDSQVSISDQLVSKTSALHQEKNKTKWVPAHKTPVIHELLGVQNMHSSEELF